MNDLRYFTFKFILFSFLGVTAQSNDVFVWYDSQVSKENTALYNGTEFINTFNLIDDKHRFFETSDFTTGDVEYNNQKYFNASLRYDLYNDEIIVKIETAQGIQELLLLKEKVNNFRLGVIYFEKLDDSAAGKTFSPGYYQLLTENSDFKLYKKNHKKISRKIKNKTIFYSFIELNPQYVLKTNDGYHNITRMRDLSVIYPIFRNELSNFKLTSKDYKYNDRVVINAVNRLNILLNN